MKPLCFSLLLCIFFAISCTKTNSTNQPDNNPAVGNMLDSGYTYFSYQGETQGGWAKFIYDDKGRLIEWRTVSTDTVGQYTMLDTGSFRFSYSGNDTVPSFFTDPENIGGYDISVMHYPQYDQSGRIIVDSQSFVSPATGVSSNHPVNKYQYHDGYISEITPYELDTFFFHNSNYDEYAGWERIQNANGPYQATQLNGRRLITASSHINPGYQLRLSNSIGVVFSYGWIGDLLLQYLPSRVEDVADPNNSEVINYSWVTDDQGRVISGTGIDGNTGLAREYYRFVYKK